MHQCIDLVKRMKLSSRSMEHAFDWPTKRLECLGSNLFDVSGGEDAGGAVEFAEPPAVGLFVVDVDDVAGLDAQLVIHVGSVTVQSATPADGRNRADRLFRFRLDADGACGGRRHRRRFLDAVPAYADRCSIKQHAESTWLSLRSNITSMETFDTPRNLSAVRARVKF